MTLDRRGWLLATSGAARCAAAAGPAHARPSCGEPADAFDAELARLRRVDPRLVGWDEVDRVRVDLEQPRGIAAGTGGRLWVVGDRALLLYGAGWLAKRIALADPPSCVCESPDGRLVHLGLGDRIEVRHADGSSAAVWTPFGENALVTSVAAGERSVFVADAGRRTVLRCGRDGHTRVPIGAGERHFVVPSPYLALARTSAGVVWAANPGRHRLESFTEEGEPLAVIGEGGTALDRFCGCCNPTHVAALADGRLVTSEKGLPRVKVLRASGELESVVVGGDALPPNATGLDLAVDDAGRVLVLVPAERAVRVFAPRRPRGRNA